jgi:hypothetical protein
VTRLISVGYVTNTIQSRSAPLMSLYFVIGEANILVAYEAIYIRLYDKRYVPSRCRGVQAAKVWLLRS